MSTNPVQEATAKTLAEVQAIYANAPKGSRSSFEGDKDIALAFYNDYVDFVCKVAPINGDMSLLDVGCGCGWSSYAFAQSGYSTTGIDLNANAFEPPPFERLKLLEGSAMDIRFPDASFNVVTTYQCIEHVPEPETALKEMMRVCKPGGVICIVGPNLVSPFLPIKHIANSIARGEKMPMRRTGETPHHPYGNTLPEVIGTIPTNIARLAGKMMTPKPSFTMREPDTVPPFHSDNDACYMCNPVDFIKFFPRFDCEVIQVGKIGRPPLSYLFMGGTWIAARKL